MRYLSFLLISFMVTTHGLQASEGFSPVEKKCKVSYEVSQEGLVIGEFPDEVTLKVTHYLDDKSLSQLASINSHYHRICEGEFKKKSSIEFGVELPLRRIRAESKFIQPWKLTYFTFCNLSQYNNHLLATSINYADSIFIVNPLVTVFSNLCLVYKAGVDYRVRFERPCAIELMLVLSNIIGPKAVMHFLNGPDGSGFEMNRFIYSLVKDEGFHPTLLNQAASDDPQELTNLVELCLSLPILFMIDILVVAEVLDNNKACEESNLLKKIVQSRLKDQSNILGNIFF